MSEEKRKRKPRRLLWWAAALALVPIALYALAKTDRARQYAAQQAVIAIHDGLGLDAHLGDVNLSIFPPTITASDIALVHHERGRLLEAEGLAVSPSLWAILQGKVDLQQIEIEHPRLRLVLRDGKIVNFPELPKSSGSSKIELPFSDLALNDADIDIDVEPRGILTIHALDVDVAVEHGDVLEVRATSHAGRFTHAFGEELIEDLAVRARIAPHALLVHEARVRTDAFSFGARRVRVRLQNPITVEGRVDASIDLARAARLPHDLTLPHLEGRVSVRGTARWDGQHATGDAHVSLDDVIIKRFGTGDAELDVTLRPNEVEVRRGHVVLVDNGGTVDLQATLGLTGDMPLRSDITLTNLEFAKLMKQLGVSPNAIENWNIDGHAELNGTCNPLSLEGPINLRTRDFLVWDKAWHAQDKKRIIGAERADIDGRVSVRPDALRFEQLQARLMRSRLRADVLIGFGNEIDVHASSDHFDLADATPLMNFELGGVGSMNVAVTGDMSDPQVRGHMTLADFVFDGKRLGDIDTDWHLEQGGLAVRFPMISARKNESHYRVEDLYLDFTNSRFLLQGLVHADNMHLQDYYSVLRIESDERFTQFQAQAHGEVPVRFTLGYPGDSPNGTLLVDLDLALGRTSLNDFVFERGSLRGRWDWRNHELGYEGGTLTIEHAELEKSGGALTLAGSMRTGGHLDLMAVASGIPVSSLEGLRDRLPELGGEASATARIGGTLGIPRAHFDVQLAGLTWKGARLGDARAYVRLTDQNDPWITQARTWSRFDPPANESCAHARAGFARGTWPEDPPVRTAQGMQRALDQPMAFLICGEGVDGQVRVDLALGRTQALPVRGRVDLIELDPTPFFAGSNISALRRRVTAHLDLTGGSMKEEDSLVGRVLVDELRLGEGGVEVRNNGLIDVRMDRGRFELRRAEFVGPGTQVRLSGGGSLRNLDVHANGDLDVGFLASASPAVADASGRVTFELHARGPATNPDVFGSAHVEDSSFQLHAYAEPIEHVHGEVAFAERRVEFQGFEANVAGGTVTARGVAEVEGLSLTSYQVFVGARDISLRPLDGLDLSFGANTTLRWARGERTPSLGGEITVQRFSYTRPIQLGQTLGDLSRRRRAIVERYDPNADRLSLDLRVNSQAPLRVVNNLVDADVSISDNERAFRIVGTDQRIGVLGSLDVNRGTIHFRNSNFDIQRGSIDFDDESQIDPRIDIRASTLIRRSSDFAAPFWRISLRARGTSDALQLDTSAEPDLSQEDIVLLLTLGMTRAEAQQLQAGQIGQTAALEALATITGIDREVRNVIPAIDDFRLSSAYSVRTGRMEPQIAIGKRITDRIRLSGMTGIGEARELRANLEWRLSDSTSLQASYDNINTTGTTTFGNIGADLRWRLEFE